MKLNNKTALDFIEEDLLYCWGCPSYPATLVRMESLHNITVDPDIQAHIEDLIMKLILCMDEESYEKLFYQIRLKMENGVKSKVRFAKQLMEMETKGAA